MCVSGNPTDTQRATQEALNEFGKEANYRFKQAGDLNTNLNSAYQKLLASKPASAPDITDPAVQHAYRAQVLKTKSQTGLSSTFMGGNGAAFTDSFLGG